MSFAMNVSEAALERIFPDSLTVESSTTSQDAEGTLVHSWTTRLTDIPAQLSPVGGGGSGTDTEVRNAEGEFVRAGTLCYLYGDHDISEEDRAVVEGVTYDIVSVQHTSWDLYTVLHLERRDPTQADEESS